MQPGMHEQVAQLHRGHLHRCGGEQPDRAGGPTIGDLVKQLQQSARAVAVVVGVVAPGMVRLVDDQ
jgi:hypothetical protein